MNRWVLSVELDGEWEECTFRSRSEALAAFVALVSDYNAKLVRAVLISPALNGQALNPNHPDGRPYLIN